jgi:hypothetical protein
MSARTLSSISLTWTASTVNIGVTNYRVQRNGTTVATLNSSTLTFTDSGLSSGTSYNYTVVALDANSNASLAASLSASTIQLIPGDIDGNGTVNIFDLSSLLSRWGTNDASRDLNNNGIVDIFDLSLLLANWG